jgi:hypothetical protein
MQLRHLVNAGISYDMRVANCIHGYTVLSPKELASVPIVAETFGGNMSLSGIESWW